MAKKKKDLTLEEKLQNALVPEGEQPYPIPENWVWTRLGEVCQFQRGITFPSSAKKTVSTENLIPCVRTANVQEELILDDLIYVDKKYVKDNKSKYLMKNDIIMSSANSRELVGKTCFVDQVPFLMTFGGFVLTIRAKRIYSKLLFYMLRLEFLSGNFIKESTQTTNIANISTTSLSKYKFPLPPIQEQRRIVERIESLFSKLDEAKEKIQLALDSFENRKSAILYQAFSGELTKKWREENGISLDDWEEVLLKDTLYEMTSKKPSGEHFYYIDIDSVDNKKQEIRKPKIIDTSKAPSRASREVLENDTLFSMVRPYLKNIAFIDPSLSGCIASTGFYVCRPNNKIYPRYLYALLRSSIAINYTMKFMKGDNSPSIRKSDLENMPIHLPSILEQKEIVRILDNILEKEQDAEELIEVIEKIDLMKKSILARAFRGELGTNIPEEESAMELLKSILEA